jgi:pyridoxamine 5'-phosphate oxidase family protein
MAIVQIEPERAPFGKAGRAPEMSTMRLRKGVMVMQTSTQQGTSSVFTPAEIAYLQGQRLARLATVGLDGQPHVVPVGFRYNPELDTIEIGGHGFAKRKKYRDVHHNPRVAFLVDDVPSVHPWRARGIEIRGAAALLESGGTAILPGFDPEMFRITPQRIISWGIEEEGGAAHARSVV